jgi:CheY-like chemotaxis protein
VPPSNYHVIVVDDDEETRVSLRRRVEHCCASARVFDAANGQEALKLYEAHGADLLIIEHHIPLLDGLGLVRYLRAHGITIPLVLTSINPQIERLCDEAGGTQFVPKKQLLELLEKLLPIWLPPRTQ